MNYEKQTWAPGELITSAKLNHMEQGIEDAGSAVALPEITASDDGKVMVAKNGEWANEELLTVGTEHVILPETDGVNPNSPDRQYNLDLTAFPSVSVSDLQYIAVHNGRRYELSTILQKEDVVDAFYPPDFDIAQADPSNMPEIAITIVLDGPNPFCMFYALPEDTSHTLTLMAKTKTLVKNERIPFAIKAGSGMFSIAEGHLTTASGIASHAEGGGTTASGIASHAEGMQTTASGTQSHAEGFLTTASDDMSHAEGVQTTASGPLSHAEGSGTTASGACSHAEGDHTTANHRAQHVFGEFNVADTSTADATARGNYVEIVGNGTYNGTTESRSNARTLDWNGNEVLAGGLTVGAAGITIGSTTITEEQLHALLAMITIV